MLMGDFMEISQTLCANGNSPKEKVSLLNDHFIAARVVVFDRGPN